MVYINILVPSPDWIVGVSGLELCLKNCSWVWSAELDLFPWDVGTDSGVTYTVRKPIDNNLFLRVIT